MASSDAPASTFRYNEKPVYTTSNGAPIENPEGWQRPGPMGPLLLQDFHLIDMLAHFDRMYSLVFPPYGHGYLYWAKLLTLLIFR